MKDFIATLHHLWFFRDHAHMLLSAVLLGLLAILFLVLIIPPLRRPFLQLIRPLTDPWNRFWFDPMRPQTLGFCRLFIMLGAFLYYSRIDYSTWGLSPGAFWKPVPLFAWLHLYPLHGETLMWSVGIFWKLCMLLGALGLFSRLTCGISFVLGIYLIGLPNNIGKIDHNDAIMLWSILILALGRSGDAWSLDRLIRAGRGKGSPLGRVESDVAHPEYRWPLRMMQVTMAMVFCLAGIAKLRNVGFAWAFSDNLRNTFISQQYLAKPLLDWGLWIAAHPVLCHLLGLMTLICETGMPLTLFSRTVRWLIIPALFGMQIGNELLLGINFRQFMVCYACWVAWGEVGSLLRGRLTILFDGSCGLCQKTMSVIRRLDLFGSIEILDAMNGWPEIAQRFPSLNQDQCLQTMHVVDEAGGVTTGFFAYRRLAWKIPLWWPLLPILYFPGVPTVGEAVYQKIALQRFNNGCGIDAPPAPAGSASPDIQH